jgi:hypothetical protein
MMGVALLALGALGQLTAHEQMKVDALRASGADVRVERSTDGRPEIWVDFPKRIEDAALRMLSDSANLTVLRILEGQVTDAGLDKLKNVPRLWLLVIKSDRVSDNGCRSIARLPALRKLDLMGAKLSASGLRALSGGRTLRELYLHGARIEPISLSPLMTMTRLNKLSLPKRFPVSAVDRLRRALPKTQISQY